MKLILISVILLLSISLYGQFRESNWGESVQEVKHSETAKFISESNEGLVYEGSLTSTRVQIIYYFIDGKLIGGGYQNLTVYLTGDYYVRDFNTWKEKMIKKYGQPTINNTYIDSDYKDEAGAALMLGKAAFDNTWITENAVITHNVAHADFKFTHTLLYFDLSYMKNQKDSNDGF